MRHIEDDKIRFHMPGHSGVDIDGDLYRVAKDDITELSFSDNLAHPTGELLALEEKVARIYHAKKSLILTEGATAGIQVALLIAREARGEVYLMPNAHKSCTSFASIIGLRTIDIATMDEAIAKVSEGAFIYVTTPNYYGEVVDITPLLNARANGGAVIVDEAHGSHFVFSDRLPASNSGRADFVVESLHKTLPVFTGGAVLNVNRDEYLDMAEYFKCKIHSTSPSYLIMESIARAMDMMERRGAEYYDAIYEAINAFKAGLDSRYNVVDTADYTRLVIRTNGADAVAQHLESEGIYIELYDECRLVLIVTPFNVDKLDTLRDALNGYHYSGEGKKCVSERRFTLERAKSVSGDIRFVRIEDSIGKVAMNEIAIYPPGVPVAITGDILTREVVEYIAENRERIVGLIGDTIPVRDVCEEN